MATNALLPTQAGPRLQALVRKRTACVSVCAERVPNHSKRTDALAGLPAKEVQVT